MHFLRWLSEREWSVNWKKKTTHDIRESIFDAWISHHTGYKCGHISLTILFVVVSLVFF